MFKPVVISTVAKTTDESTGSMGFGIFYMMVNVGGFLGPIVAGVVRGWDWKEYAGRIAPTDKVGMYMGYFYWCVALGNLFGGLLSGVAYGYFGPRGIDNPDAMWVLFAALAATTAVSLVVYNRYAVPSR